MCCWCGVVQKPGSCTFVGGAGAGVEAGAGAVAGAGVGGPGF